MTGLIKFFCNVHEPSEEKSDDSRDILRGITAGDFNTKAERENIFKPTTGNVNLHQDNNENGVRIVNLVTSKNLVVKITMFPHRNIYKYTWTSPDGKAHNQIDHILIDRRWH